MFSLWPVAAAAIALGLTSAPAATGASPRLASLQVEPLASDAATPAHGPVVVLFWRADCGPCLLELSELAAFRSAAKPLRVVAVGLQPAALLTPALSRMGLSQGDSLRTDQDAAGLLTRFGGAPARLPLTVAFDAAGRVCGRRTGYLGTDQLRAWAAACGGARAPG